MRMITGGEGAIGHDHERTSHELRTPLTSVHGYAATMLERWDQLDDRTRLDFLSTIYSESLRLIDAVEQLDAAWNPGFAASSRRSSQLKAGIRLADAS